MHLYVAPVSVQPYAVAVCRNKWFGVLGPGKAACQSSNVANSAASAVFTGRHLCHDLSVAFVYLQITARAVRAAEATAAAAAAARSSGGGRSGKRGGRRKKKTP